MNEMRVVATQELHPKLEGFGNLVTSLFVRTVLRERLFRLQHITRETLAPFDDVVGALGEVVVSDRRQEHGRIAMVRASESAVALVACGKSGDVMHYSCTIAAADDATRERVMETLDTAIVPVPKAAPDYVDMRFWTHGPNGPADYQRRIHAPSWREVQENYSARTRALLTGAMALRPPVVGGQLLLFHGRPGVGKTYAIQSLVREWSRWCHASYIVDPDEFFGTASYLLEVLLRHDEELTESGVEDIIDPDDYGIPVPTRRRKKTRKNWHLLIIEDADEFVTSDAKRRSGQSLSRLLNLTDGLVGHGLRILVLLTANEPIEKMHRAIVRPGRCLANIQFDPLDREEAVRWVKAHGIPSERWAGSGALSDLYALSRGTDTVQERQAGLVPTTGGGS